MRYKEVSSLYGKPHYALPGAEHRKPTIKIRELVST